MPLWRIFYPDTAFTDKAEKKALSDAITAIYTKIPLPAFYVVVTFVPVPVENIFVGGVNQPGPDKSTFIRIVISNIARRMPEGDTTRKNEFMDRVEKALKPFIADKGWDWEVHAEETDRDLWRINGIIPPQPNTEDEKRWVSENKVSDYPGGYTATRRAEL
ncbi:hypothetical protein FH972_021336 [Carpinus fangiana]|uniref:Tautomerase cis-CaaD-like domain-containing protein n=1 Tax=Carpinus fangiana TaxID=176857 RepID=A0A5N6KP19_9ROSI|nr:hypothetical protein FH972_021336 [Carpinus fangiana]